MGRTILLPIGGNVPLASHHVRASGALDSLCRKVMMKARMRNLPV